MKIDNELGIVEIGENSFEFEEYDGSLHCEIDLPVLSNLHFKLDEIDEGICFRTHSVDGFGSYLFNDLEFAKSTDIVVFAFICHQPNKYWEGQWGLSTMLATLADVIKDSIDLDVQYESLNIEDDWKYLEVTFSIDADFNFSELLEKYSTILKEAIKRTELILSGAIWKKDYEENEKLFCTEIIFPLLRKMDFIDVRFNHGIREYGKDFTFSEVTKFGNLRHFAIQVKAGNLRGNVNSDIDEILGQLNDAFTMPYYEVSANESRNISIFIIAISGHFTENAKDKLIQKIPQHFKGCVYLLDRDKILELIERYWK
ncbi:hypothetical protein AQPE_4175 [Aquipluma nitroreducens]|uniref:Restriction endonuclease type IV Mrr domain-containing protein n=1 Tax=Aquipluma nitroreducens TaxID=2010828 RepID=A0A5K7SFI3_9BACT|nr:hypothetical protein [Aquipluma nitroreducens]BBE19984.1 hypothetical protein AQPE_4175 [Aquipluma nitroreducens]